MPRYTGSIVNNNFLKGLITEASPFQFPQGACTETVDCTHEITGSIDRRRGFDYEINHSIKNLDRTNGVVSSYLWRDVAGDGNTSLVVLQVKDKLYFYDGSLSSPGQPLYPLSGRAISANINLNSFSPAGAPSPKTQECQFTSGHGKLFVVHPYLEAFSVAYDINTQTFATTQIDLKIRDIQGMTDDPYAIDERPALNYSSLPVSHKYNLFNQGWTQVNIDVWDTARTDMPSNADVMWTLKNALDHFMINSSDTAVDPAIPDNKVKGNSPAPKGHFILDVYNQDRGTASGLGIPAVTTGYRRASTATFFSGRLFFSGVDYTNYNSNIYFSQIIERDDQFGACYQANDLTAETLFDLVPSDGGVIKIQEAGTILKLVPVTGGMVVFASNGVWMISGSTGLGFTATDYSVSKISSIQILSPSSFVDVAGIPMFWNLEGIYKLASTQGAFTVTPITTSTIKTYFDTIPPSEKRNARGFYNPLQYVVQWLFRSTSAGDLETYYDYDRILNFDVRSGAFYVWTIPTHSVKIHGLVVLENRGGDASLVDVTSNSTAVVTANSTAHVQAWTIGNAIVTPAFKYIVSNNNGNDQFTFAETRNFTDYVDWKEYDSTGVSYTSHFTSGYSLPNPMTDFESNYVNFYSHQDSKYYIQGIWDFANSGNSGRWSMPQLIDATTSSTDYDNIISRRKIRGRGKTLQIKVTSYPGKNFTLHGWAVFVTGNQTP